MQSFPIRCLQRVYGPLITEPTAVAPRTLTPEPFPITDTVMAIIIRFAPTSTFLAKTTSRKSTVANALTSCYIAFALAAVPVVQAVRFLGAVRSKIWLGAITNTSGFITSTRI